MGSPKVAFLGKPGKPWFGGSKDRRFLSKQLKTMVLRGFPEGASSDVSSQNRSGNRVGKRVKTMVLRGFQGGPD